MYIENEGSQLNVIYTNPAPFFQALVWCAVCHIVLQWSPLWCFDLSLSTDQHGGE